MPVGRNLTLHNRRLTQQAGASRAGRMKSLGQPGEDRFQGERRSRVSEQRVDEVQGGLRTVLSRAHRTFAGLGCESAIHATVIQGEILPLAEFCRHLNSRSIFRSFQMRSKNSPCFGVRWRDTALDAWIFLEAKHPNNQSGGDTAWDAWVFL